MMTYGRAIMMKRSSKGKYASGGSNNQTAYSSAIPTTTSPTSAIPAPLTPPLVASSFLSSLLEEEEDEVEEESSEDEGAVDSAESVSAVCDSLLSLAPTQYCVLVEMSITQSSSGAQYMPVSQQV